MRRLLLCTLVLVLAATGCAAKYTYREPLYEKGVEGTEVARSLALPPDLEEKILALNPEAVSARDIKEVLSHAPAPRIMNIHGGIFPVYLAMESFSKFLVNMGYPEGRIRNPADGSYSYSCYDKSSRMAGQLAWFYEREGMRPMIVGHSQGGIQALKVLHQLQGTFSDEIQVWNALENRAEERSFIIDPLSGRQRPVVGLKVSYATAVGSGGFTRFLPNQWIMLDKLRSVPDSVDEFTGFYMGMDILGGDLLGFGSVNKYKANGTAKVRNVKLPSSYSHVSVPVTEHLSENQEIKDWINAYAPSEEPEINVEFSSSSSNILWGADVWFSIKKHWVLEIQNLIRAKRRLVNG